MQRTDFRLTGLRVGEDLSILTRTAPGPGLGISCLHAPGRKETA